MGGFSEDELREVVARYEATKKAALAQRDASLRAFHAAGGGRPSYSASPDTAAKPSAKP